MIPINRGFTPASYDPFADSSGDEGEFSSSAIDSNSSSGSETSPVLTRKRTLEEEDVPKNPAQTPEKVKRLEKSMREWDPSSSLIAGEKKIYSEGIIALGQVVDSPHKKKRSFLARRVIDGTVSQLASITPIAANPQDPQFHRQMTESLNTSPWCQALLSDASKIDYEAVHQAPGRIVTIYNAAHIFEPEEHGEKTRGFHFCPPHHELRKQIQSCSQNCDTGVWSGFYKGKFSTFFPDWVQTETEVLKVLDEAIIIRSQDNAQLRKVQSNDENKCFYVQTFVRLHGRKIQSAFPLFCFENWTAKNSFKITNNLILSKQDVLDAYKKLGHKSIRFEDDQTIVVDIAEVLPSAAIIMQGIYFEIPRDAL